MTTLSIPALESGVIRVFALSMSDQDAKALRDGAGSDNAASALNAALGARALNLQHVEVFTVADLSEMSLAEYLQEGAGALPSALEQDRSKLAALDGWVMVVYSSAFGGVAQKITPAPELTLIASYPQEGTNWTGGVDLRTPSAAPNQDPPEDPPVKKRPSDAAMSGRIATLALLVAFGVVGLMLWVGS
ncbi:hypothetical protein CEP88_06695 [Roseobacter denitrificans]|uniref:Uncharacterized protein n=1 Tax=Roseobacter denitrificans (strain ATCC 33942 / OCh 114) TaxID=375451 RepID=Q163C4_ROSDO|nr:hypothetical protein [Roseobacter denitrificans]ABG32919.1 hypothetical protein RD1_3428 [Roseobacter denitrificans OCh 114]AVL52310.1 hypothetical protein CEP88_06695 [Roseobacter denitrificans]SFG45893.1 hypothetical protein SAMN05443635_11946 [Roseobacter denitrificans OCh 114]